LAEAKKEEHDTMVRMEGEEAMDEPGIYGNTGCTFAFEASQVSKVPAI